MKIGVAVPKPNDPHLFASRVKAAEETGLHALLTFDHGRGAEPFSLAGFIASITRSIRVCGGIMNPFIRHPAVLASGTATLDRLSYGRFTLVMGVGWKPWIENVLGVARPRPFADFRNSIRVIRRLLRGEEVSLKAVTFSLNNARLWGFSPVGQDPPIYVAGGGIRGLTIAAQEADGFLTDFGRGDIRFVRWMRDHVNKVRPPTGKRFRLGLMMTLRLAEDSGQFFAQAKESLAWNLSTTTPDAYFDIVGLEADFIGRIRRTMGIDDLVAASRDPLDSVEPAKLAAAAACIPDDVARELIPHGSLIGSPEDWASKLLQFAESGVDFIWFTIASQYFDETVDRLGRLARELGTGEE